MITLKKWGAQPLIYTIANFIASSIVSIGKNSMPFTISFLPYFSIKSLKSFSFSFGNKNRFTPDLIPPNIFRSSPPIAVTLP